MTGDVSKQTAVRIGVCGVLLLICGTGCLVPGFVLIGNDISTADGLWSGALLLIAGVLGVVTWLKRNRGVLTGFLVLTIFAIIAMFIQSIVAGVGYSDYGMKTKWYCTRKNSACYCYDYRYSSYRHGSQSRDLYCNKAQMNTITRLLLAIVIFSVIGGCVSFIGSIFGCMGSCSAQVQPGAVIVQRPVIVTTSTLSGYPAQPGYSAQQPGYLAPQQQPGQQAPQSGYQAPMPDYQAPQPNYQAPQTAYATPQASSSQQQVPNEPPPEYSKYAL